MCANNWKHMVYSFWFRLTLVLFSTTLSILEASYFARNKDRCTRHDKHILLIILHIAHLRFWCSYILKISTRCGVKVVAIWNVKPCNICFAFWLQRHKPYNKLCTLLVCHVFPEFVLPVFNTFCISLASFLCFTVFKFILLHLSCMIVVNSHSKWNEFLFFVDFQRYS